MIRGAMAVCFVEEMERMIKKKEKLISQFEGLAPCHKWSF